MLQKLEDSVQQVAADIVDNICERGEVDFVVDVAAALPLKIVCDLMGVPESHYQEVFDCSNVILGAGDPEYVPADGDILSAIFNAGLALQGIMEEVAESKRGMNSMISQRLLTLNSKTTSSRLQILRVSSSSLLSPVMKLLETLLDGVWPTDSPDQRQIWVNDFEKVAPTAVEEIVRESVTC